MTTALENLKLFTRPPSRKDRTQYHLDQIGLQLERENDLICSDNRLELTDAIAVPSFQQDGNILSRTKKDMHADFSSAGVRMKGKMGKEEGPVVHFVQQEIKEDIMKKNSLWEIKGEGTVQRRVVVSRPKFEFTCVPISGYTNFLRDPDYIKEVKKNVIGKIIALRKETMETIRSFAKNNIAHPRQYTKQYRWAVENMKQAVLAIQRFNTLPIDTMSENALLKYVDGVEDNEQANLILEMSSCRKFEVSLERFSMKNNFAVSCTFDGCFESRKMFGKEYIECFEEHNKEDLLDDNGDYVFMLEASEYEEHLIEMEEIEAGKIHETNENMCDDSESSDEEPDGCMTISVRKKLILEKNYIY